MLWGLIVIFALWDGVSTFLLIRASKRLLQFDSLLQSIVDPLYEYRNELARIATAEGLLHDHPEVLAFHRANMVMLERIEAAIKSVKEGRPQEKPKGLPPRVV